MSADLRTLEKRIIDLEQAAETKRTASSGVQSGDLRHDELVALAYRLVPAQDGERVRRILRSESHVIFPPKYNHGLQNLSLDEKKAILHDLRRRREKRCGCTLAEERQRLLETGAYVEFEADPHA